MSTQDPVQPPEWEPGMAFPIVERLQASRQARAYSNR
jgi:hypothetical protein